MTDPATTPPRDYWPTAGWRSARPEDHGLDARRLAQTVEYLAAHVPHMNSLLIVRGGYLVAEHYRESDGDRLRNLKSVTKSVLSSLIGIAIQTGDLPGVHATLGELLPEQFTSTDDRRKRAITLADLLTMRSGLDWREWEGTTQQMTASPNWVRFVLDRPLVRDPGAAFNYSTGDTQLLAAVLHYATGMSALAFADLYLFDPLGIERRTWPADPQGINVGGAELSLSPRDMAKFGYVILNGGQWDDETLLPAGWVDAAFTPHTPAGAASDHDCERLDYGYLWWLRDQGAHPGAQAVGYGGQFVYVIPALDLVVVMTGDLRHVPPGFRDNRMLCRFNVVEEWIVPAVVE